MSVPAVPSYAQVRRVRAVAAEYDDGLDLTAKTIALVCLVPGPIDVAALEEAVRRLVSRHRVLQYRFTDDDGRVAVEQVGAGRLRCDVTDLTGATGDEDVREWVRAEVDRPFDLLGWPLLRAGVVRAGRTLVHLSLDHLVTDGWSQSVLMRELPALYHAALAGRPDPLPPAADFFAFGARQRHRFDAGPGLDAPLAALRRNLRGRPLHPPLALDVPWDTACGRYVRRQLLDQAGLAALNRWCRERKATLFMAVLAALGIALREIGGAAEAGMLIATHDRDNQDDARSGIGWYANMLPLYFPVTGPPGEVLGQVRRSLMATLEFHGLPLARAAECLPPGQGSDEHPSCFVSLTDDRSGDRADGPPAGPVTFGPGEAWERVPASPAYRRGYGLWVSLHDDGLGLATASPAVLGDAGKLEDLEAAFAATLNAMPSADG